MVFTGLVQAVGQAVFDTNTNKLFVKAAPSSFWQGCTAGDSIAVNGCCLTLLFETSTDTATFFIMEESRKRTNIVNFASTLNTNAVPALLASSNTSTLVNLEKALKHGDPLGGHTVTGHIDGTAPVVKVDPHEDGSRSVWVELSGLGEKRRFLVQKGSITLDGVSLTVAEISGSRLRVSLIPHTLEHTNLQIAAVGTALNIEFDQALKFFADSSKPSLKTQVIDMMNADDKRKKDEEFMLRAIQIGESGRPTAPPNPWVGCVITDPYGEIIGEGFHKRAGQPHAEINAINDAICKGFSANLDGATCYATLEPCSHTGRTGPCDQEIIRRKFARVVIALQDPDSKVSGTGIKHLQEAGIQVTIGILAEKAEESLRSYLYQRRTGLPWVVLKIAASLDGKIAAADGTSQWVTSTESRMDAHARLRSTSQVIVVGSKTASIDNPSLTVRSLPTGSDASLLVQPLRVVVGTKIQLGPKLLNTSAAPTVIYTTPNAEIPQEYIDRGVKVHRIEEQDGHPNLKKIIEEWRKSDIIQVLVEGGGHFASAALHHGIVNQLVVYTSPHILGSSGIPWSQISTCDTMPKAPSWKLHRCVTLGNDVCADYIIDPHPEPETL